MSAVMAGGWRSRITDWWHGRGAATTVARSAPIRRPETRQRVGNRLDRERLLAVDAPQYVWGEGRVGPGSRTFYEKLLVPLNPPENGRMLILGAGLGGPAREISKKFGVQVLGLEASPAVVAKGTELLEAEGAAQAVSLRGFSPEMAKLTGGAQDVVLAEPLLFAVQNKLELLRELDLTLKPGGKIVLLDYVVGAVKDDMRQLWEEWQEVERPRPRPRTLGELKGLFKKAKLKVRATHDVTARYNAMVTRAWARCLDRIEALPRAEQQADPVIQSVAELAETWGRRSQLMEHGVLRVVQITGSKAKFGR
jgi:SAM-dependent methyltransferase